MMKYKESDRVRIKSLDWYNENKNKFGKVWTSGEQIPFDKCMSEWCGKVMTISHVRADHYTMVEDLVGYWTDEMIECKMEPEPKFKVGDKVKDKNNRVWFIVRVSETFFDISSIPVPNAQGYFVPMEDQDDYELVPQCFSNDI